MEMTVETSAVEVNSKITVSLNLLEGEGGAEADFGKGCVFLRSTGDVFDQSPDQVKQACYDLGSITVNVKTVVAGQQELYFVGATAEDGPVPTLGGNVTLNWTPGPTASLEAQEVLVDGVSVAAIDAGDEACFGLTAKDAYGNVAAGETRTPVGAVFALTGSPSPQVYAEEPFVAGLGRVCFTSTTPGSVQARASLQLIDSNVVPATFRAGAFPPPSSPPTRRGLMFARLSCSPSEPHQARADNLDCRRVRRREASRLEQFAHWPYWRR